MDNFDKKNIYLLRDSASLLSVKEVNNRCNIYDYETIIKKLPKARRGLYLKKSNAELFVNGLIDAIFRDSV